MFDQQLDVFGGSRDLAPRHEQPRMFEFPKTMAGQLPMATERKHTKFQTCERHRWLEGEGRNRRAEFFVEGGPANQTGCRGGTCRLWPGTDLFVASICTSEYELEWTKSA